MSFFPASRRLVISAVATATAALVSVGLLAAPAAAAAESSDTTSAVISRDATFEWGINAASQGASFNGACSFFVAGIADGTEASYRSTDGDVVLIKRGVGGQAIAVDAANRCAPVDGDDGAQRVVFTKGVATRADDGIVTVQWRGAFTIYSYGGLVPWYVADPKLTVETDGTGSISATLGGYGSSMENPSVKVPLAPEPDMTILDLDDVSVEGDAITATPAFEGVDYFALTDPKDPASPRRASSSVPDDAKAANPNWGSWPEGLTDFHYRTGLSTYWHTSGLSADLRKPPLPIRLALSGGEPQFVPFASISFTREPTDLDVVVGTEATFEVAAESAAPLSYQWRISDDGLGFVWRDIEGATDTTLRLTDVQQTGASGRDPVVQAVATNGIQRVNTTSARLRARPADPVTVISQPLSATRFVGASVDFSVYAEGFPAPWYQWQTSRDEGATWADVGEPSRSTVHVIPRVAADQDGMLVRALLPNGLGDPVATEAARLTVLATSGSTLAVVDDPTYPYPLDPALDENVLLLHGGGLPDPSTSDSVVVGVVARDVWDARGAGFSAADILGAQEYDTATNVAGGAWGPLPVVIPKGVLDPDVEYVAVIVSGAAGDRSYDGSVSIRVLGQTVPVASVSASQGSATSGTIVTLTATVSGTPAPTVQWQRRVAGGAWADVAGATSATLATPVVTDAEYRVVASNAAGRTESDAVAVALVGPPPTVSVPTAVDVTQGDALSVEATVTGSKTSVQWQVRGSADDEWTDVGNSLASPTLDVPAEDVRQGQQYRVVVTSPVPQEAGGPAQTVSSDVVTVELRAPAASPLDVPDDALLPSARIDARVDGSTLTANVGERYAGRYVGAWIHSTPRDLGWHLVAPDGSVSVALPALDAGTHRLVLVDDEGALIGWASVEVAGDGRATVLAATGVSGELLGWSLSASILLLLGGAAVLVLRRSRVTGLFRS